MNKRQEIEKAERSVANAKDELLVIGIRLSAIEREIDVYLLYEVQLIENINILKRQKIVALAQEYKRAKHELSMIRAKLVMAYNDRSSHEKAHKIAKKLLKESQANYDIMVSRYDNNVVQGKFRRNDGQG